MKKSQINFYLEAEEGMIAIEDADVQAIIASVQSSK